MNERQIFFIVTAILQSSNASKQKLGQRIAYHLGFTPGPRGSDDGIDGYIAEGEHLIHFQCKLKSDKLNKDDARAYFSDIEYHQADISFILSGVGFKSTFKERLFGHQSSRDVDIHLLELKDILENNEKFIRACSVLPRLRYLDEHIKKELE